MSAAEERSGADDEEAENAKKKPFARPSRDAWASSGSDQAWKGYGIKETIEEGGQGDEAL